MPPLPPPHHHQYYYRHPLLLSPGCECSSWVGGPSYLTWLHFPLRGRAWDSSCPCPAKVLGLGEVGRRGRGRGRQQGREEGWQHSYSLLGPSRCSVPSRVWGHLELWGSPPTSLYQPDPADTAAAAAAASGGAVYPPPNPHSTHPLPAGRYMLLLLLLSGCWWVHRQGGGFC